MKNYVVLLFIISVLVSCADQTLETEKDQPLNQSEILVEKDVKKELNSGKAPPKAFETVRRVVDKLPLFGGCTTKSCSDNKLIEYISKTTQYPELAKSSRVEGRVFVQFIVEIDGTVSNVYVVRDLGAGTGAAAAAVVEGFNDLVVGWSAGEENGVKVPVMFTLPFAFRLE